MAKDPQREPVNPKWLLRTVMAGLPKDDIIRSTVVALWAYSDDYLLKEDLEDSIISFSGTVTYGQIAGFLGIGESTAKWRLKYLRKQGVVVWKRVRYGICFSIAAGSISHIANGDPVQVANLLADSEIQIANGEPSSQLTENSSQLMETPQIANGLTPLALSGLTGLKESGLNNNSHPSDEKSKSTPTPQSSKPIKGDAPAPMWDENGKRLGLEHLQTKKAAPVSNYSEPLPGDELMVTSISAPLVKERP